ARSARSVASDAGVATLNTTPGHGPVSLFGRNRMHRSAVTLACEHEALVALLGGLSALLAIATDAFGAEIGQEAARLALDIGAHVPGVGGRHQCRVHDLCDMGAPRVLCLRR